MKNTVFVDSSVWIDFFREQDSKNSLSLKLLLETGRVAISHIIMAEILPFIKKDSERKDIESYFKALEILPFETDFWPALIDLSCSLQKSGISGTTIPDLIIATICLKNSVQLFSADKHFRNIARAADLKMFDSAQAGSFNVK